MLEWEIHCTLLHGFNHTCCIKWIPQYTSSCPSPTRLFLQNTPPNPSSLISSSLACSHAPNLINADHVFSEGKTAASNDAFHHKWMFKPISSSLEEHYKPPTLPHPTPRLRNWQSADGHTLCRCVRCFCSSYMHKGQWNPLWSKHNRRKCWHVIGYANFCRGQSHPRSSL